MIMEAKMEETPPVSSGDTERETAKEGYFSECADAPSVGRKITSRKTPSAAPRSPSPSSSFLPAKDGQLAVSGNSHSLENGSDSASAAGRQHPPPAAAVGGGAAAAVGRDAARRHIETAAATAAPAGRDGLCSPHSSTSTSSSSSTSSRVSAVEEAKHEESSMNTSAIVSNKSGGRTCTLPAAGLKEAAGVQTHGRSKKSAETAPGRGVGETRQEEEEEEEEETDGQASQIIIKEEEGEEEEEERDAASIVLEEEEDIVAATAPEEAPQTQATTTNRREKAFFTRSEATSATGIQANFDLEKRLEELLQKTDTYSAKIHGGGAAIPSAAAAAGGGGGGTTSTRSRRALSEKEEDDILLRRLEEEDIETRKNGQGDGPTAEGSEGGEPAAGQQQRIGEQPACIIGKMKHYQIEGLNWLYQLHCLDINGILADEMGLGKTLQTISILAFLQFEKKIPGPHLVICPRSTLDNWFNEVSKWCPRFRSARLHGTKEEREILYETVLAKGQFDVCITTYEMVIKDCHRLASSRFKWNYLIMDEAHRIKNEKSVLSEVVRRFKSKRRLLITGTPLQNNLRELWALLNFIMPQLFDSTLNFESLFDFSRINTEQQQHQVITTLHRILRPFMLRRLKADVARDLPPKREVYVFVGMSTLQKKLYADILSKNIEVLNAMSGNKTQMLNILMQLRKCCNHPYLFDGVEPGPPFIEGEHMVEAAGKMALLDKLLPRLKAEGSRVLLFSQMTRVLDILDDYCRWRGYEYCRIDGSTPGTERQERIDDFNSEGSKKFLFLLSTRAGGLGINLATADIVILFDSDFNPQMDLQAMDRAHRIGQKKKVVVYRFVTEATVEERIVERAAKKLKLDSLVIQKGRLGSGGGATSQRGPSTNELHEILQFGAQEVYRTQGESSITEADLDVILADAEQRTAEIQAQLTSLENKFDLSNISLDGGLHMYGADDDESGSQPGKPGRKKAIKLNRPATFFELGDRKTKWRGDGGTLAKKERKFTRRTLSGWRAEINGGYDFQFFNAEQLDYLDSVQRRWQTYIEERKRRRLEELRDEQRAAAAAAAAACEGDVSSTQEPATKKYKAAGKAQGGGEGEEDEEETGNKEEEGEEEEKKEKCNRSSVGRKLFIHHTDDITCRDKQHATQRLVQQLLKGLLVENAKEEKEKEEREQRTGIPQEEGHVKMLAGEEINIKEEGRLLSRCPSSLDALTYNQLQSIKELLTRYCRDAGVALSIQEEEKEEKTKDQISKAERNPLKKEEEEEIASEEDIKEMDASRVLAKELQRLLTPVSTKGENAVEEETATAFKGEKMLSRCIFPHPASHSFNDALLRLATQLIDGEAADAGLDIAVRVTAKKRERQQGISKMEMAGEGAEVEQEEDREDEEEQGGNERIQQQEEQERENVNDQYRVTAATSGSNSSSPCGTTKKKAGRPRKAIAKEEGAHAAAGIEGETEDSAALLQLLQQEDLDDKTDPNRPQEFTEEMNREKERLLAEGFGHWNRTEFTKFVSALIHFGKDRLEEAWVAYFRGTSKTLDDVQEYANVFFKRYLEVDGGDRIMQRVEKAADLRGALDSQRRAVQTVVEEQLCSSVIARPQDLQLPARLPSSSVFTKDEDRMLLWGLYEQGINAYALVHAALKYYWFDTRGFFRIASRTVKQVEERCKEIVAAVEAELSEKTGSKEHLRMRQFRHTSHRIGRPPTRTHMAGSSGYRNSAGGGGNTGGRGSTSQPRAMAVVEDCSKSTSSTGKNNTSQTTLSSEGSSGGARCAGGGGASCREEDVGSTCQSGIQKTRSENFALSSNNDCTTDRNETVTATRDEDGRDNTSRREIDRSKSRKGGTELGQESIRSSGSSGGGGGGGNEQQQRSRGGGAGAGAGGRRRGRPRGGCGVAGTSSRGAGTTAGSPSASENNATESGHCLIVEKLCTEAEVVENLCLAESGGVVRPEPVGVDQSHIATESEAATVTRDTQCSGTSNQDADRTKTVGVEMTSEKDNTASQHNLQIGEHAGEDVTMDMTGGDGALTREELNRGKDGVLISDAGTTGQLLSGSNCSEESSPPTLSQKGDANEEHAAVSGDTVVESRMEL